MDQRKIDDKDLKKVTGGTEIELNRTVGGDPGKTTVPPGTGNPNMPDEFDTDAPSGSGGTGTVDFNRS